MAETTIGADLNIERDDTEGEGRGGIKVCGENLISMDSQQNILIGDGAVSGKMNLAIGGEAPEGKFRVALGVGAVATKDFGTFARKDLAPVVNGANLTFDPTTGQIGPSISSCKFKKEIVDLKIDSTKIYSLEPRSFVYSLPKLEGVEGFGLIAEEVREVIPELVVKSDFDDSFSVNYLLLPVLLLNELKKMKVELVRVQTELVRTQTDLARVQTELARVQTERVLEEMSGELSEKKF